MTLPTGSLAPPDNRVYRPSAGSEGMRAPQVRPSRPGFGGGSGHSRPADFEPVHIVRPGVTLPPQERPECDGWRWPLAGGVRRAGVGRRAAVLSAGGGPWRAAVRGGAAVLSAGGGPWRTAVRGRAAVLSAGGGPWRSAVRGARTRGRAGPGNRGRRR